MIHFLWTGLPAFKFKVLDTKSISSVNIHKHSRGFLFCVSDFQSNSTLNCTARGKSVSLIDNWDVWDLPTKGVSRQGNNKVVENVNHAQWSLQNILMKYLIGYPDWDNNQVIFKCFDNDAICLILCVPPESP